MGLEVAVCRMLLRIRRVGNCWERIEWGALDSQSFGISLAFPKSDICA